MSQNFSGTRNIISFLLIATILVLLVYLSSDSEKIKQETIHIGIAQWPGSEYLFIAHKQGFFKQVGLDIELVELSSLAEVRRAFEREKIDGMASTLVEVLEAYKYSGLIAQPILVTDYSKGADEILSSNKIKSISDLKGKKIGIEAGSLSAYLVNSALEINNINYSEVIIIPMELHALPRALKTGKVDAITSFIPESIAIKKQLDVNVIFDSSSIPQKLLDVISINQETLTNNSELQEKLIQAWGLALEYAHNNPDASYTILTERLPISIDEFKQSMNLIHLVNADEQKEYFHTNGIIKNNIIKTAEIIFMHIDNSIDYSQFIYEGHIN